MQILRYIIITCVVVFSSCGIKPQLAPTNEPSAVGKFSATVVGVGDGDTITVRFNDKTRQKKIRLATIDAPEFNQPFGKKSKQSLSDLVYNKQITINSAGGDKYGRIVAEVFVDGKNVNVEQIRRGYAWHYVYHAREQTQKQRLIYAQAQEYAKANRLGIWEDKEPVPPWNYRKQDQKKADKPVKYNQAKKPL